MFRLIQTVALSLLFATVLGALSESAYTLPCLGQGIVYSDSNFTECECFNCFYGANCENEIMNCTVDCTAGNPSVAQQYWEHVFDPNAETVSLPYYRSPYQLKSGILPPGGSGGIGIDKYIHSAILNMHNFAGNVKNPENYWIVYAQGGTQLINALIYALATINGKTTPVFAQTPFYNQYQNFAEYNSNTYWNASYYQTDVADEIIEFVTAPNNPTGEMRTAYYSTSKYLVYDMVYYWPTWTNISFQADYDTMIFSLSKLTGHAGSRFGWALVKDPQVASEMRSFINLINIHTSLDTVHRAATILNAMVSSDGEFFDVISNTMAERYARILPLFENQSTFTIDSVTSPPTWFYMWIKCEQSSDCVQVFADANMKVEDGQLFGSTSQYIRIQLTMRSADFEIFYKRLESLLHSAL